MCPHLGFISKIDTPTGVHIIVNDDMDWHLGLSENDNIPATRRGRFLHKIGSRNTVPAKIYKCQKIPKFWFSL
jgi:hypothetical protein